MITTAPAYGLSQIDDGTGYKIAHEEKKFRESRQVPIPTEMKRGAVQGFSRNKHASLYEAGNDRPEKNRMLKPYIPDFSSSSRQSNQGGQKRKGNSDSTETCYFR
ncbi:hypothetical protein AVEN_70598-1 [Araneus ventricosus]|uniref:Uncharacterized protein n=1 Tax=Araneus ventricosus TaxID=182803 RepID=A0A4Y2CG41_ARAVE|nr:hypothetical protein AVEN_70598-1 [Araneus ventricosus]